jgi:hypothetical protein
MRRNGVWPQFFNWNQQPDGDAEVKAGSAEAALIRQHFGPSPVAF